MSSAQLVYLDGAECKVISVNTVVVYKNRHLFIVQKKKKNQQYNLIFYNSSTKSHCCRG